VLDDADGRGALQLSFRHVVLLAPRPIVTRCRFDFTPNRLIPPAAFVLGVAHRLSTETTMKLPPFDYACPATIAEAVSLLASHPGEAKVIAGGQSLMPMMAFRLATPSLLVDLRKLDGLDRIEIGKDGIRLGAKVRWRDILDSRALRQAHPLLVAAIGHVAHYQIRNRGTVGGSLAHADPAAEMPGIAVACDALVFVTGKAGSRVLRAQDFLLGALTTALQSDEIITEIRLPPWPPARRWGFEEFARRRGDFALAAVAAFYDEDGLGRTKDAHIGVIGVSNRPLRIKEAEVVLNGRALTDALVVEACRAVSAAVNPPDDIHASAEYRRALAGTLTERALMRAAGGAG
jgi:aerobic carbon-monoxide dehydrogenase medium subunit